MQQDGSIYFARNPTSDPRVKRSNSTFSEHKHFALQLKGNCECKPAAHPYLTLGAKDRNSTCPEYVYVAYQRESQMQQHESK